MYDGRDGLMHGLDMNLIETQRKVLERIPGKTFAEARREAFVKAGEAAGIPERYQGPVFEVGEIVILKGARFRVERFRHGKMLLAGKPG